MTTKMKPILKNDQRDFKARGGTGGCKRHQGPRKRSPHTCRAAPGGQAVGPWVAMAAAKPMSSAASVLQAQAQAQLLPPLPGVPSSQLPPGFRGSCSQHRKSLRLLTTKLVSLLQEAPRGILDLKVAADTLDVRHKRRIYDITNVLEGINLIEKSRKAIQWKGVHAGSNTKEVMDRLRFLKAEIEDLKLKERELDQQKLWLQKGIKSVMEDSNNNRFSFVTPEDICNCFNGDTLLAFQAPSGMQLELPIPEMGRNGQKKYPINLKSHSGPIHMLLINRVQFI